MSLLILVTEPEYRRGESVFAAVPGARCVPVPADEEGLAAAIRAHDARYVILGHSVYRDALYAAMPRGGVLARFGVGHEGLDKAKATRAGLVCTNTPGTLDQSVAELTMLLVLAAARHLPAMDADMHAGRWVQQVGLELAGATIAFVGAGRIAQATARIASTGFGMKTIGCRRSAARLDAASREGFDEMTDDYTRAVADADFVVLLMPALPENRRFLSADRLAALKPSAWVINTARGAVLDEVALYEALAAGRLAGAALDVFDVEPYVPADASHDLRTLSNVIMVPHVGSHTHAANHRMASRALANVLHAANGRVGEMDVLNREVLEAWSREVLKS